MYLAPHFPHSHFSYSPVSPLFPCFSVSLLVCSLFFTFLCPFVLLSSYVSRHPCSERSSLSRFLFPTSLFPLSHSLSSFSKIFSATLFFPSILFLRPSNFDLPTQKQWKRNSNQQTTLSELFFIFQNSLFFDKSIVFLCMFRKTRKINQILHTKS